ncbi:MAG TPA: hypothetical protein V6C72_14130 [Chroococcales cyanobacterium]
MAEKADYRFEIKCANPAEFTLSNVIGTPRTLLPLDVKSACDNLLFESESDASPEIVPAMIRYLLTDFFQLLHRTGLYNRQKLLWESFARVAAVDGIQLKQGIFSKTTLPEIDLYFNDKDRKTLMLAHVVEESADGLLSDERKLKDVVRAFQHKADKLKASRGNLTGIFLCFPKPFPEIVLRMVESLTGASDPVGKYDSRLPEPLGIPLDLVEYERVTGAPHPSYIEPAPAPDEILPTASAAPPAGGNGVVTGGYNLRLVHPDLSARK